MANYNLNKTENKLISEIISSFYMEPTLKRVDYFIEQAYTKKTAWKRVFDQIYSILVDAKEDVENILKARKKQGQIADIRQSMKSIAGHTFSNVLIYVFLKNKIVGNIKEDIFIANKKSQVKGFEELATILVGNETQKPDVDLIIHTNDKKGYVNKCIILSLKTSLRERAGQTYKWKLLMEIATTKNPIKNKYKISYNTRKMPFLCFATVNFYNEINNPQHRGMFQFFDESFIAKPLNKSFISRLSYLVDFVNEKL